MDAEHLELLERLAAGGTINNIISRLETIITSEYPIPVIPPPRRTQSKLPQPPLPGRYGATNGVGVSSSSRAPVTNAPAQPDAGTPRGGDQDNADPALAPGTSTRWAAGASVDGLTSPPSSSATHPTAFSTSLAIAVPEMPQPILELADCIMTTLKTNFAEHPPHTVQRLAALILSPRDHYRYLAPYLHAVDRVINVTTTTNLYPMTLSKPQREAFAALAAGVVPSAPEDPGTSEDEVRLSVTGMALPSGSNPDNSLGALLTPIPWLRHRTPNALSDESTTDDGSSPLSAADGSDVAFSTGDSAAESAQSNGLDARGSRASTLQLHPSSPSLGSQHLHQQGHTSQHRMEVRTEAIETIEGPNGMGSIETVSVSVNGIPSHGAMMAAVQLQQQNGITQGELLRQEQTAGVVPVAQLVRAAAARAATPNGVAGYRDYFGGYDVGDGDGDDEDEDDEDEDDEDDGEDRYEMNEVDDDDNGNKNDGLSANVAGRLPGFASLLGDSSVRSSANTWDTAMGGTGADPEPAAAKTEADGKAEKEAEDIPHARGPQEIGAADMGPQLASSRTGSREAGGLLIGSAADARQVDMRDIDVEAAVGRKASALPSGIVAAPLVPQATSSRAGVQGESGGGDSASELCEAAPAEQQVRSDSPKREAEQALDSDGPAKRRRRNGDGDADADSVLNEVQAADAAGSGKQLPEKAAGELPASV
ncbi:hypothetical protein SEPCBS119000_000762 [Sporothrix epigloea]|uniref:Protein phosphatase 4 core regulatory subunit R2 n=1 Tax=Sporothrix epigloea TaxID=1892477 RepID=A0ABP0D795_9PEZI